MSFRCQITNRVSKNGDKLTKIVASTREKTYFSTRENEDTRQMEQFMVAKGWEIVKELHVSQEGANLWNSWTDEQRKAFLNRL